MSWRATALVAIVGWGAISFGGVYPWAYVPLFVACGAAGVALIVSGVRRASQQFLIVVPLVFVALAIALQLVPLPYGVLERISPHMHLVLRQYDLGYATALNENRPIAHALSVDPAATWRALGAFACLSMLLIGGAASLTPSDARAIGRGITLIAAVVAFEGILQRALANGRIYGFWRPLQGGAPFGPFVNRNHFAGWMLMAVPLSLGELGGRAAHLVRQIRNGWRATFTWFQSVDGNVTTLLCFAVVLMISALVLALSRSGIVVLVIALVVCAHATGRPQTPTLRAAFAAYLVLAVTVGIVLVGVDAVAFRFAGDDASTWGGRRGAWSDAIGVAREFPLAGFGLNTYGRAMLFYQRSDTLRHYSAAHNDYLQVLADGGALLTLPAGLAVCALVWAVRQRIRRSNASSRSYWVRVGAATGLLAIALQEFVDFSLQIPGDAALFAVVCAVALHADDSPNASATSRAVNPPTSDDDRHARLDRGTYGWASE
jgi:O-antigen ligase